MRCLAEVRAVLFGVVALHLFVCEALAQDRILIPKNIELSPTVGVASVSSTLLIGPLDSHPGHLLIGEWNRVAELVALPEAIGQAEKVLAIHQEQALVCGVDSCVVFAGEGFGAVFRIDRPATSAVALGPDQLVVAFHDRSPQRAGLPLHLIRMSTGEVLRSFGSDGELRPRQDMFRYVTMGGEGVWTTPRSELSLELWHPENGELLRRMDLPFALTDRRGAGPVTPVIVGVVTSSDTMTVLVSEAEKELASAEEVPPVEQLLDPFSFSGHTDGIALRVNSSSGEVISVFESERHLLLAGHNTIVTLVREADGEGYVERVIPPR